MQDFGFAIARGDFYHPLGEAGDEESSFRPGAVPAGWSSVHSGIWRQWLRDGAARIGSQGWKVHVTASVDRAGAVLDVAAGILFAEGVVFKHLGSMTDFLVLNHKHASRTQSGKFIAAYPNDEETAERLMEALASALVDESGPYVLTDRPFRESSSVFYRYGAFRPQGRLCPDGSTDSVLTDGHGKEVPDRRRIGFHLPDGVTDPFHRPPDPSGAKGPADVNGYMFEKVVRYSNAGGTYKGVQVSTGRPVFIKEARPHAGLVSRTSDALTRIRAEHRTLRRIHQDIPGICPEPIDFFSVGGHAFLVTEFIEGKALHAWNAAHNPLIDAVPGREEADHYYRTCTALLEKVGEDLDRLHEAGFAFLDLSPDNVLVLPDGTFRLVDFETAAAEGEPVTVIGTPGFFDVDLARREPRAQDRHALASLALYLLAPVNDAADRNPEVPAHLRRLLRGRVEVPEGMWSVASGRNTLPLPAHERAVRATDVEDDAIGALSALRDDLVRGILTAADPENGNALFPTVPDGFSTNTLSVEHGAAGVLHALARSGTAVPDAVTHAFARSVLSQRDNLAPGLFSGLSGIAWVLAETGRPAEAHDVLMAAARHPLLADCPDLAHGRAGVVLALLDLYRRTGDAKLLDAACSLRPGETRKNGYAQGDAGVALALYYLGRLTDDPSCLDAGTELLVKESERAVADHGSLLFPMAEGDPRIAPYLWSGSAGIAFVADRFARTRPDERVHALAEGTRRALDIRIAVRGGLFTGLSGLGLALADRAARTGDERDRGEALAAAEALFLHAVPTEAGTYVLGGQGLRLSCDLGTGSAGALLFLQHALEPAPDAFFTLDAQSSATCSQDPGR
ncbi:class III lanthionine synthetase LanKC [Streptomyces sp. NPDC055607]